MSFLTNLDFWFTTLRCTTPVLFATMAALIASRSGMLNLGLEGAMTVAALCGVLGSGFTGSLFAGALCGLAAGTAFTMLLAYFVQHLKANRVVSGVALNLAASGGSVFCLYSITGDKNASNSLASAAFPAFDIPVLKAIPGIGDIVSGHNCLTYVAFIVTILLFIVLNKTAFGIHIRAVGESEEAARSVGINVEKIRYQAMLLSGLLASLGGMYLSMGYVNRFTSGMVAGRGYIALATNAMAAGNALMGMVSSVLYGFGSGISIYLQNNNVDPYLITMVPYASIIVFYVLFSFYYKVKRQGEDSLS
ncbi:ABC transporter permease [Otoolea muris]|uniref:ABC transporter permease n=1 Tax=Otoolea muris TaxID=2941515 RepID=UPI00204147CA|nr:ABC transporter permease [Otoolea muris]